MKTPRINHLISQGILIGALFGTSLSATAITYSYDTAGRLSQVSYDNGTSITYSYDNNGNLLQRQTLSENATNPADANNDGSVNILDAITILIEINAGNSPTTADCNGDNSVNILDAVCVLIAINAAP